MKSSRPKIVRFTVNQNIMQEHPTLSWKSC